jgi:1-acyl-sn-glycerol-3-phosphate acyltransferase
MVSPQPIAAPTPRRETRARYLLSYARSLLFTNLLIYFYTAVYGTAFPCSASLVDCAGAGGNMPAPARWSMADPENQRNPRARGRAGERPHPDRATIYCVNHQSAMDIPVLFVSLPAQFRFVAKRSLFNLPFMGSHLTTLQDTFPLIATGPAKP